MTAPLGAGLPPLGLDDFAGFFSALWSIEGVASIEPFPWQIELLESAHRERRWPDVIDLPTGAGKTSIIDLAVFLLALGAGEPPSRQWHPRRIAMVVDRRVIVDQAADRARCIAERLANPSSRVMAAVAARLGSLALGPDGRPPSAPLRHAVLRGGIVLDETWAHRPDVPAVVSATVDQIGSRLLLRGYGVSRGMRPIHAGLLGEDVLYLLDEVHLARPYAETLDAVRRYRRLGSRVAQLPDRWQAIQLSATVDDAKGRTYPGRPLDPGSHPVLARRLTARKPAALTEVPVPADPARARQRLATAAVDRALGLVGKGARTIAVIVNRVDTARRVHAALRESSRVESTLITGRMRPIDRDEVMSRIGPRIANGRRRHNDDSPLIIVATQCIEAGADFDLDAIVTECASLDALRQRFGRVDRDGALGAAGTTYESSILAASRDVAEEAIDAVYGEAQRNTWRWLSELSEVDFGIQQLRPPSSPEELARLLPPRRHAPVLLPSHLDRWARTSQYGVEADPEVAHWLHGIEASAEAADVSVVWRDDIDDALLAAAADPDIREALEARLNACPPRSSEMLSVPIASVRAWLSGLPDDLVLADAWAEPSGGQPTARHRRNVLCWRDGRAQVVVGKARARDGDDSRSRADPLAAVAPGETIVVPASWGGIVAGTWDPSSATTVPDVAEKAYGNALVLRLSRTLDQRLRAAAKATPLSGVPEGLDDPTGDGEDTATIAFPDPADLDELTAPERRDAVRAYLAAIVEYADPAVEAAARGLLGSSLIVQSFAERLVDGQLLRSYVASARQTGSAGRRRSVVPYSGLAEDDGRDGPSFVGDGASSLVTLPAHLEGVRRWAECLAANLGFPEELVASLGRAGQLHDIGKLDPRFQLWLHGGNEVSLRSVSEPLAKSLTVGDRRTRDEARRLSGYPLGQRHELLSLSLAPPDALSPHPDLVRHLVATHHGNGRYRFDPQSELPAAEVRLRVDGQLITGSTAHELERLDSGIAERVWALLREWGWFGLCWVEAVLRLADHQDSRTPGIGVEGEDNDRG